MAKTHYTTRSLRQRGQGDTWEVTLSHRDPATGKTVRTYHTIKAKDRRQAEKRRNELILELERKGGAIVSGTTVREFMDSFLEYKEKSGTIEASTVRDYRFDAKYIDRYIGAEKLSDVTVTTINTWMAKMSKDGYSPKSVGKAFRLLKQALNWAMAQDYLAKNPCDFCKPPKRVKTPINALNREDRTRMMRLARSAQPEPLAMAIELALTTGMRRGEICALRWSDLNDDGSITVSHALGNGAGGFYEKGPKTSSSLRTIPLTARTFQTLKTMRANSNRRMGKQDFVADPYILGTQGPESRPYNPSILGKDFAAFCKMNGFRCTFHDLRHTFATMMIGGGTDIRTVADYLGHSSVTMTLEVYADVDPEAKKSAVSKVENAFDLDFDAYGKSGETGEETVPALTFTVEQLEAMLAWAKARKDDDDGGEAAPMVCTS